MTSKNQSLEIVTGNSLYECIQQIVPGTALTSAELTTKRRDNVKLRHQMFWIANFALYRMEDEPILYFGGREANPLFNNIEEAVKQLKINDDYVPTKSEFAAILESVESGSTFRVKQSELGLKGPSYDNEDCTDFIVNRENTHTPNNLNPSQHSLVERIYGSGDNYVKNMEMIVQCPFSTVVAVVNPNYVRKHAGETGLVRACALSYFGNTFSALIAGIDRCDGALLGVRRRVVSLRTRRKIKGLTGQQQ